MDKITSATGTSRYEIMDAIDRAKPGDTIMIPPYKSDFVDKLLTLKFEQAGIKTGQ